MTRVAFRSNVYMAFLSFASFLLVLPALPVHQNLPVQNNFTTHGHTSSSMRSFQYTILLAYET